MRDSTLGEPLAPHRKAERRGGSLTSGAVEPLEHVGGPEKLEGVQVVLARGGRLERVGPFDERIDRHGVVVVAADFFAFAKGWRRSRRRRSRRRQLRALVRDLRGDRRGFALEKRGRVRAVLVGATPYPAAHVRPREEAQTLERGGSEAGAAPVAADGGGGGERRALHRGGRDARGVVVSAPRLARRGGGGGDDDVASSGSKRRAQEPHAILGSTQTLRPRDERVSPEAPQQGGGNGAVAGWDAQRDVDATGRVLPRLPRARGRLRGGARGDGDGDAEVPGAGGGGCRGGVAHGFAKQRIRHRESLHRGGVGRGTVRSVPQLRRGSGARERFQTEPPVLRRFYRFHRLCDRVPVGVRSRRPGESRAEGARDGPLQVFRRGKRLREGVHDGVHPVASSPLARVGASPRGELQQAAGV